MKLSELDTLKAADEAGLAAKYGTIEALRDERRSFGEMLQSLDNGEAAQVTTVDSSDWLELRPAAFPHFRKAVIQSVEIVEQELVVFGVEIDEPCRGWETEDDDSGGAEEAAA
jgi:hypothetical protein